MDGCVTFSIATLQRYNTQRFGCPKARHVKLSLSLQAIAYSLSNARNFPENFLKSSPHLFWKLHTSLQRLTNARCYVFTASRLGNITPTSREIFDVSLKSGLQVYSVSRKLAGNDGRQGHITASLYRDVTFRETRRRRP